VQWSSRRFFVWLGVITALGLAVRLAYALIVKWDQPIWGDAFTYHYTANGLADGYGFQTWLPTNFDPLNTGRIFPNGASADNPPLFPLYLAAWSLVGLDSFHAHMIASTLLGTATVFVMGLIGRRIAGPRTGLIAAGLAAVYANFWVNDAVVTSESLAILVVAITVLLAYRAWDQPTLQRILVLGAFGGLACLVRSEVVLLLPLIIIPLVIRRLGGQSVWKRVGYVAAAGVVALLVMSPWLIRNMTAWKYPETLSTDAGLALQVSSCDATYHGRELGWWSPRCQKGGKPKGDPSEQDQYWRKRAFKYIGDNLDRYPVVVLARIGRMWEIYHPGSPWGEIRPNQKINFDITEGRSENAARIALAQFYLLVPFVIAGIVIMWRRKVTIIPLASLLVLVTITAAYSFGNTRYRSIAEISIAAFAAVAFDALLRRYWDGRKAKADDEPPPSSDDVAPDEPALQPT
jgi:hypothetical protein